MNCAFIGLFECGMGVGERGGRRAREGARLGGAGATPGTLHVREQVAARDPASAPSPDQEDSVERTHASDTPALHPTWAGRPERGCGRSRPAAP